MTSFSETFEDVSFTKALQKWLNLKNEQKRPLDGTQKNETQPVYVKTAQDLISRMDDTFEGFYRSSRQVRVSMAERRSLQERRPET